jgi:putative flippase GtrA
MSLVISLVILFVVAFVQNMAFTWVSRSRNSGDPNYHRWAAICSNGVWFITQLFILSTLLPALTAGEWWKIAVTALVYIAATTEGSVYMMKVLLKKETGKRKVGAS